MMPAGFAESNTNMSPPSGMTEDDCGTMRVFIGQHADGSAVTISRWKVSVEELEQIKETGDVWLYVFGAGMPPVGLGTGCPFDR